MPYVSYKLPSIWPTCQVDKPNIGISVPNVVLRRIYGGFTLTELIAVLTIAGILAAIAAPSISQLLQSNTLTATTNEFLADLKTARSEAVKRGIQTIICESTTSAGCTTTGSWNGGWMIFSDTDASGAWNQSVGAEDVMIRYHAALPNFHVIAASATSVTFNQRGGVGAGAGTYTICNTKIQKSRVVNVGTTGQVTLSEGICP